ncbi:dihydrodipicolinate synthase family protein [Burkholderia sp. Ax-1724]|uniref:dihydrodipicolinate synthase family protein n=1 Tax=Burkholderia sp. Ax-1724 TaxID=2608336 RepID=UPI00141EC4A0|nr:dihydrodipicolinate synthase family protein [Burkholderia sp. Ax-1724]
MTSNNALTGVVVATVLPFNDDESIDWTSYERALAHAASPDGIEAVFVNGHAGEGGALSRGEREDVIRCTRERLGAARLLIAGILAQSTREAVVEACAAAQAGADLLTVFPPATFAGARPEMVVAYVRAIAEAVERPVIVFQYPLASGYGYSTETLVRLAALPSVVAVKEGSDSMRAYEDNVRALKAARPEFAILASNFDWFLAQLASGADGILSGLASLAPRPLVELWRASQRGDIAAMRAVSASLQPLVSAIYMAPRNEMYARIKYALQRLDVIASARTRSPFQPIDATAARAIDLALAQTNRSLLAGG